MAMSALPVKNGKVERRRVAGSTLLYLHDIA